MTKFTRFDAVVMVTALVLVALLGITVIVGAPPVSNGARVAYLYPANSGPDGMTPFNIWLVDPSIPNSARQITDTREGVYDYDPSPDGRSIAYAERSFEAGVSELMLLDVASGATARLTNCQQEDADCVSPLWRSDSRTIAYLRRQLNTTLGLGTSPTRLWILELEPQPVTYALFEDSQILGSEHTWSADGSALAFYEGFGRNILVYDFTALTDEERIRAIPSDTGTTGRLSPGGDRIAFPQLILPSASMPSSIVLGIADLQSGFFRPLTPDEPLVSDGQSPAWHPDGLRLAFARRYLDERATRGEQVYLLDLTTNEITQLIYDPNYTHGALSWNPEGTHLLMQRFNHSTSLPEIWTYELASGRLTLVADNAWYARWLPAPLR